MMYLEQHNGIEPSSRPWQGRIITVILMLHNSTQMYDEQVHLGIWLGYTESNCNHLSQSQTY